MFAVTGIVLVTWIIFAQSCLSFRKSDVDAKAEFARENRSLSFGNIREKGQGNLHYAVTGDNDTPTIYFVHGSPGSWDAFEGYMRDSLLLQKYRMVSVDRPGFGHSNYGKPEHLVTQSEMIQPLFYSLDNHRPRYLAGHSLGGPMVLELAADMPDSFFSGVVVISGSIDPKEENPERWRPWLFNTPLNYLVPGAMRPSNEELWFLKSDLYDLQAKLKKITAPVYFIHGAQDPWVPPGNVNYGQRELVNAASIQVTMIPGANHFIPWTKFSEIRTVLLNLK